MPPFDLMEVLAAVAGLLAAGLGLAYLTEVIVEYLIKPLIQVSAFIPQTVAALLLKYIALAAGGLLAWFAGYDVMTPLLAQFGLTPHPLLGPIASAIMVGGGAPLIHAWIEKWRGGESLRTTGIRLPEDTFFGK